VVAGPVDLGGYTKAEVDAAARTAGFADADYPYFSGPNGCGPEGWKSRIVPERSHIITGSDFGTACNAHDRAYMTLGKTRAEADKEFRSHLRRSVGRYQVRNLFLIADHYLRPATKESKPKPDIKQRLRAQGDKAIRDLWRPWKWRKFADNHTEAVQTILLDEAGHQAEQALGDLGLESKTFMLKPSRTLEMFALAEIYYQAVRRSGEKHYDQSQTRQREYEAWLTEYLRTHPRTDPRPAAAAPDSQLRGAE
jgi:hypothetical protein